MVAVKEAYRNKGAIILVSDKSLAKQGISNKIALDVATQSQLEYLASINHDAVEVIKVDKKKETI